VLPVLERERERGCARQEESRGPGGRRCNNATTQQIFQQRDGTPWKKKDGSNTKDETRSVKQVQGEKRGGDLEEEEWGLREQRIPGVPTVVQCLIEFTILNKKGFTLIRTPPPVSGDQCKFRVTEVVEREYRVQREGESTREEKQ